MKTQYNTFYIVINAYKLYSPVLTFAGMEYLHLIGRIQTKVRPGIGQLTCKDDRIWVGNGDNLLVCIDQEGNEMETVCLGQGQLKNHAMAEEGNVYLINQNSLMKRVRRQLRPFISYFANGDTPMCVARSSKNDNKIVELYNQEEERARVTRKRHRKRNLLGRKRFRGYLKY